MSTMSTLSTLHLPHPPSCALPQHPALPPRTQVLEHHEPAPLLSSQQLMQGHKTVAIVHNGITYRLQATRLGKLILTK